MRLVPELFLTVTVAPGVPVPVRLIAVAVVPHARVIFDTGKIVGVLCVHPQFVGASIENVVEFP